MIVLDLTMSMLSALVSDDVPSNSNDGQGKIKCYILILFFILGSPNQQSSENSSFDELLNGVTLEPTTLGDSINNVKVHWNQLLSQVLSDAGNVQPTHDHVKELAEFSVKQLKESCLDVTKEFHKVALEWQFNNPEQGLKEVCISLIFN